MRHIRAARPRKQGFYIENEGMGAWPMAPHDLSNGKGLTWICLTRSRTSHLIGILARYSYLAMLLPLCIIWLSHGICKHRLFETVNAGLT